MTTKSPVFQTQPRTRGQPTKYRVAMCKRVIKLGIKGKSRCQISGALKVDWVTLSNWEKAHPEFFNAMARARELAQVWWEEAGQKGIKNRDFNAQAYRLQVCNRFPTQWRDTTRIEHSGPEGGPIEHETTITPQLPRARLLEIIDAVETTKAIPVSVSGNGNGDGNGTEGTQ